MSTDYSLMLLKEHLDGVEKQINTMGDAVDSANEVLALMDNLVARRNGLLDGIRALDSSFRDGNASSSTLRDTSVVEKMTVITAKHENVPPLVIEMHQALLNSSDSNTPSYMVFRDGEHRVGPRGPKSRYSPNGIPFAVADMIRMRILLCELDYCYEEIAQYFCCSKREVSACMTHVCKRYPHRTADGKVFNYKKSPVFGRNAAWSANYRAERNDREEDAS